MLRSLEEASKKQQILDKNRPYWSNIEGDIISYPCISPGYATVIGTRYRTVSLTAESGML